MYAKNILSLQEAVARKFVVMGRYSTSPVMTVTKSAETGALRHAKWNTGINAKDHRVNAYIKEISSFNSIVFINRTY